MVCKRMDEWRKKMGKKDSSTGGGDGDGGVGGGNQKILAGEELIKF